MHPVRYPEVEVQLSGEDGNALFIISRVRTALRREGLPKHIVDEFTAEAMDGDYDHVLQTCMQWVSVA
jgi:hypothetical protein